MRALLRFVSLVALVAWGVLVVASCSATAEGDRCNPLRATDECASGLVCTVPANCAIAVCCPPPEQITSSSPAECLACPGEGGVDDADAPSDTDAASEEGADGG